MHETVIAGNLIDMITESLIRENADRVVRLTVEVGLFSGVAPAALRSAFFSAVKGNAAVEGAVLDLREVAVRIWCEVCQAERPVKSLQRIHCADCDTPSSNVVSGLELDLVSVEVV